MTARVYHFPGAVFLLAHPAWALSRCDCTFISYHWTGTVAHGTGHSILGKIFVNKSQHKIKNFCYFWQDLEVKIVNGVLQNWKWVHPHWNQCGSVYSDPILPLSNSTVLGCPILASRLFSLKSTNAIIFFAPAQSTLSTGSLSVVFCGFFVCLQLALQISG